MAVRRPRKMIEFPLATDLANGDLILIDKVISANTTKTMCIKAEDFNKTNLIISGPFEDDIEAGNNGVLLGNLYYTASGDVKLKLT